jgi:protein tyrosine phosphatase
MLDHIGRRIFWHVIFGNCPKSNLIIAFSKLVRGHAELNQYVVRVGDINGMTPTVIDLGYFVSALE